MIKDRSPEAMRRREIIYGYDDEIKKINNEIEEMTFRIYFISETIEGLETLVKELKEHRQNFIDTGIE